MTKQVQGSEETPHRRREIIAEVVNAADEMGWQNVRALDRLLAPFNITIPQAIVLALLERRGPDLEMSRIAALTSLPASTITSIMDRLIARGWAERRHSESDRRRVTASVTEEGIHLLRELAAMRNESYSRIMERFTVEELQLLVSFIHRWRDIVDEITQGGSEG